jgi:hypothetical protein
MYKKYLQFSIISIEFIINKFIIKKEEKENIYWTAEIDLELRSKKKEQFYKFAR